MEFFVWLDFPRIVFEFIPQAAETAEEVAFKLNQNLLICLLVAGALYLVGLVMGGIGLHAIAKREGLKHSFLGFLPFANTWYAGKLAGQANFFGQKMKRAGLYAAIVEVLYVGLEVFLIVLQFCLTRPEFYTLGESAYYPDQSIWQRSPAAIVNAGKEWQMLAMDYCGIVSYIVYFLALVFFCVVFIAFFRKYYARSPIVMTLLSVLLPGRGFTVFAVRNNPAVDYNEYMRRRAEEYARRYGNPYGGPYGGTPYGQNGAPSAPPQDDVFGEFGDRNAPPSGGGPSGSGPADGGKSGGTDDPFSDF